MAPLNEYGWSDHFARQVAPGDERPTARVIAEHRQMYRLVTAAGECNGRVAGRLRHHAAERGDLPAVGDWVLLRSEPAEGSDAAIDAILDRRSAFSRKAAGETTDRQILAANIDTVWIVSSLDHDLSPCRIERYLALGWESGANPVVVLNKADLCDNPQEAQSEIESVAPGTAVHVVSALTGAGVDALAVYLRPGSTVALLGSSGVGKSTLINRLAGHDLQRTAEVRQTDSKGRHTTTARHLLRLPSGALIVDTPGMRELQLWDADHGIKDTFTDVEELASRCRFNDCRHAGEPGCAVAAAIESGQLPAERLASYVKLQNELAFLDRKQSARLTSEQNKRNRALHKTLRDHPKYKRR